jgi:hypothetical protein
MQRLGKHVLAATNTQETIWELFSMQSVPYKILMMYVVNEKYAKTRFCAPLKISEGAHRPAMCTQLLAFHMYMLI